MSHRKSIRLEIPPEQFEQSLKQARVSRGLLVAAKFALAIGVALLVVGGIIILT